MNDHVCVSLLASMTLNESKSACVSNVSMYGVNHVEPAVTLLDVAVSPSRLSEQAVTV